MKGLDKDYAKMRRDLIVAIDEVNNLKEKAKVLLDNLRVERQMMLEHTHFYKIPTSVYLFNTFIR